MLDIIYIRDNDLNYKPFNLQHIIKKTEDAVTSNLKVFVY